MGADLRGVDLRRADLRDAELTAATVIGADLRGANLRGANLESAVLRGARLDGALLASANFDGVVHHLADPPRSREGAHTFKRVADWYERVLANPQNHMLGLHLAQGVMPWLALKAEDVSWCKEHWRATARVIVSIAATEQGEIFDRLKRIATYQDKARSRIDLAR